MDIGSCKSAYNRINIVNRIIVKIIEMGYFLMSSKNFKRKT